MYAGRGEYAWEHKRIGTAYSEDGSTWKKSDTNPVLDLGTTGDWDAMSVQDPTILKDNDRYIGLFDGDSNEVGWCGIGVAYSEDGYGWSKHPDNPVLEPGVAGRYDGNHVADPHIIRADGQYHLFYSGRNGESWAICHAVSDDLVDWTRNDANPLITILQIDDEDCTDVNDPTVIKEDGTYHMIFAVLKSDEKRLKYARSDDLEHWEVRDSPVLTPTETWEGTRLTNPALFMDDDTYHLYYVGVET